MFIAKRFKYHTAFLSVPNNILHLRSILAVEILLYAHHAPPAIFLSFHHGLRPQRRQQLIALPGQMHAVHRQGIFPEFPAGFHFS